MSLQVRYSNEKIAINTARKYGLERGCQGRRGGIYQDGRRVAHSWLALYQAHREEILDWAVRSFSAFQDMRDLLEAKGGYRPTIMPYGELTAPMLLVALQYNHTQLMRGEGRRAYTPGWVLGDLWAQRCR